MVQLARTRANVASSCSDHRGEHVKMELGYPKAFHFVVSQTILSISHFSWSSMITPITRDIRCFVFGELKERRKWQMTPVNSSQCFPNHEHTKLHSSERRNRHQIKILQSSLELLINYLVARVQTQFSEQKDNGSGVLNWIFLPSTRTVGWITAKQVKGLMEFSFSFIWFQREFSLLFNFIIKIYL